LASRTLNLILFQVFFLPSFQKAILFSFPTFYYFIKWQYSSINETVLSPRTDHQQAGMKATLLSQRILPVTPAAKSARVGR